MADALADVIAEQVVVDVQVVVAIPPEDAEAMPPEDVEAMPLVDGATPLADDAQAMLPVDVATFHAAHAGVDGRFPNVDPVSTPPVAHGTLVLVVAAVDLDTVVVAVGNVVGNIAAAAEVAAAALRLAFAGPTLQPY